MEEKTPELSEREQEILRLIATGASNKEIAHKLVISPNTVKVHVRNIFGKIGAASRTEAAMYAVREGVVERAETITSAEGQDYIDTNASGTTSTDTNPGLSSPSIWVRLFGIALVATIIVSILTFSLPWILGSPEVIIPTAELPTSIPRWQEVAPMSTARKGLAVAGYGDFIYAIGGETNDGVTGLSERYSLETNTWDYLSSKPVPVSDVSAAVIGGLVFVPGGKLSSGEPTDIFEVFDPTTNTWQIRSALPSPLSGYALVAFEGRIYLFGGWNGVSEVNSVYIYDPTSDSWKLGTPMPTARQYGGAAFSYGKIFILGGRNNDGALTSCEVYQPERDNGTDHPWTFCPSMPEPRYGMGVVSIADVIAVFGGINERSGISLAYEFLPQTRTWQVIDLQKEWTILHHGLVPIGTRVFVVGGEQNGKITATSHFYQILYTIVLPIYR